MFDRFFISDFFGGGSSLVMHDAIAYFWLQSLYSIVSQKLLFQEFNFQMKKYLPKRICQTHILAAQIVQSTNALAWHLLAAQFPVSRIT